MGNDLDTLTRSALRALKQADYRSANEIYTKLSEHQESYLNLKFCSPFKFQHDIEQLQYLIEQNLLSPRYKTEIKRYKKALELCKKIDSDFIPLIPSLQSFLGDSFGKLLHVNPPQKLVGHALNQRLIFKAIEREYLSQSNAAIVVDDLLAPKALKKARQMALESTIWHDIKPNAHLGARLNYGLASPLLFQIASELQHKFPKILNGLYLKSIWSFKFGPLNSGIETHADGGLVNVNMWLTPDQANLDPSSGGMTIHKLQRPKKWTLKESNGYQNLPAVKSLLKSHAPERLVVPHKANRAVIFDSRLFHETDPLHFKDDYESRRVSLTFLFDRK